MKNLLFDIEEIPTIKDSLQVRTPSGRFTTKAVKGEFDKLRQQMVAMVMQRRSVWRQIREKDEEIKRLKAKLREYESN